jgi:hypothetical protein
MASGLSAKHFRDENEAFAYVERMCAGLEDAEFSISELIVADITVSDGPNREANNSTSVTIEALTIEE